MSTATASTACFCFGLSVSHNWSAKWTPLEEIDERLAVKVGNVISQIGPEALKKLGKPRSVFRDEIFQSLKTTKIYVLDPNQKFAPKPKAAAAPSSQTLAHEYGLR